MVVGGLQVGVVYHVEVAASTSAGVGVKSEPHIPGIFFFINFFVCAGNLPADDISCVLAFGPPIALGAGVKLVYKQYIPQLFAAEPQA